MFVLTFFPSMLTVSTLQSIHFLKVSTTVITDIITPDTTFTALKTFFVWTILIFNFKSTHPFYFPLFYKVNFHSKLIRNGAGLRQGTLAPFLFLDRRQTRLLSPLRVVLYFTSFYNDNNSTDDFCGFSCYRYDFFDINPFYYTWNIESAPPFFFL